MVKVTKPRFYVPFLPFGILFFLPLANALMPEEFAAFSDMPRNILLTISMAAFIALQLFFCRKKLEIRNAGKIVIAAVIIYFLAFSFLSVAKHEALNSTAYDLAIFDQTIWGYSSGENLFNTVRGVVLLGDHAHPILFILAPLYWICSNVNILLIFQALLIALTAIPLYLAAKKILKNDTAAMLLSLGYLT